jgi:hypothetical protein
MLGTVVRNSSEPELNPRTRSLVFGPGFEVQRNWSKNWTEPDSSAGSSSTQPCSSRVRVHATSTFADASYGCTPDGVEGSGSRAGPWRKDVYGSSVGRQEWRLSFNGETSLWLMRAAHQVHSLTPMITRSV